MFDGLVSEEIYQIYSIVTTACSCAFNLFLIYSLIVTKINHVGPYRWLLLSFAVVDVLISLVHASIVPAIHIAEFGYIFWGYRSIHAPTALGVISSFCWMFLFYQTVILLMFHYVYRFVIICKHSWLEWVQRRAWRNWISIAVISDLVIIGSVNWAVHLGWSPNEVSREAYAPILRELYQIDLYDPDHAAFLGIVYWKLDEHGKKEWQQQSLVAITTLIFIHLSCGAVILSCLLRIVHEINPKRFLMSQRTLFLQRQLFRALLYQTLMPTLTSYIPIGFVFVIPLVSQVSLGGLGTVALMSSELFPLIDPFLVFFFIQGYRAALPKIVQRLFESSESHNNVAVSQITTMQ